MAGLWRDLSLQGRWGLTILGIKVRVRVPEVWIEVPPAGRPPFCSVLHPGSLSICRVGVQHASAPGWP